MELFYPVKKVLSISFALIQFQLNIALSIEGVTACFSDCDQMLEFLASVGILAFAAPESGIPQCPSLVR